MDGSGAALGAPAFIHLKAGIRSRDLASENQETFQPTLSEGKPALQRAPGRPLNPLEPLRNASLARGQGGYGGVRAKVGSSGESQWKDGAKVRSSGESQWKDCFRRSGKNPLRSGKKWQGVARSGKKWQGVARRRFPALLGAYASWAPWCSAAQRRRKILKGGAQGKFS